jgi:hypothetical protein
MQQTAKDHPWTWRANLLGGGRLQSMAARMDGFPKLRDFWQQKKWEHGEGFLVAENGNPRPAPWLAGKPYLPAEALGDKGFDRSQITPLKEKEFHRPRKPALYSAPLVLIKEIDTLPCAIWNDGFLAYGGQIVGVHAPPEEATELREFYRQFMANREILQAFARSSERARYRVRRPRFSSAISIRCLGL